MPPSTRAARVRQAVFVRLADACRAFGCGDDNAMAEVRDAIDAMLADEFSDVARETISDIRLRDA